jgi:hypothetical protein
MSKEALKLALDDLMAEYCMERTSFAKRVDEIFKQALAAPVQEPVAWPCVISEADFQKNTVTLEMQCSDYKVGAGQHWLHTTPPATQRQLVRLSDEELAEIAMQSGAYDEQLLAFARAIEAAHGIKEST